MTVAIAVVADLEFLNKVRPFGARSGKAHVTRKMFQSCGNSSMRICVRTCRSC